MSTEWRLFAFDHESVHKHLITPVLEAVGQADAPKWTRMLQTLDRVYPPGGISKYAINGCERPVTAIEWYSGSSELPRDMPPHANDASVDLLLKHSLEALARYRLVGRALKPTGVVLGTQISRDPSGRPCPIGV
jgi:hypothetical protein